MKPEDFESEMNPIPIPEDVEPMTDADPNMVAPRIFLVEHKGRQGSFRLDVDEGAALVARIDRLESLAARALPTPRRYTGGPLEDGLYLWQRAHWHATSWASFGVEDGVRHPYMGPTTTLPDGEFVWLIGPIPIPNLPEEEKANG